MTETIATTGNVQSGMGGLTPSQSYGISFGRLDDGTPYNHAFKSLDMRENLNQIYLKGMENVHGAESVIQKALGPATGGVSTTSPSVLVPLHFDQKIVDQSRKETPLTELLPRVTNLGLKAVYNVITAKGAAYTAIPDAALNEANSTYSQSSQDIKYLYSVGRVLGQAQATYPAYMLAGFEPSGSVLGPNTFSDASASTAMQLEILDKARALKELEEDLIINGNATTSAAIAHTNANGTEFNGLLQQQGSTNVRDLLGVALQWDDMEAAVELALEDGGRPKLAVCSYGAYTQLRQIMIDVLRISHNDLTSGTPLSFGLPSHLVYLSAAGPMVVIPSRFLDNSSGQKRILFLDTDVIELRVLLDMSFKKLGDTNDSEKFFLKEYMCLINRAPQFCSMIDNIL